MSKMVSVSEVLSHNLPSDAWLVVHGQVYNMTDFAPSHPGGAEIIYQYAGKDASAVYDNVHAPSLIRSSLDPRHHIGTLNPSTMTAEWTNSNKNKSKPAIKGINPPLRDIINVHDFERASRRAFTAKAWAYINGASNDNITRDANASVLKQIWLRPSVMRNVSRVTAQTTLFGCNLALPLFISPTGAVRTAGEQGELALARAAASSGIIHCISTAASFPLPEILQNTPQHAFFQLYVDKNRQKTEALLAQITDSGKVKAIFVTVDLPVVSKREDDERTNSVSDVEKSVSAGKDDKGAGLARQSGSFIDPSLSWHDLAWIRKHTNLPLVIKGIQRWEDARTAMMHGCEGIVVSNHGGRAADTAQPSILTLLELHKNCPEVFGTLAVLVDGGFRRGSDIVKAICLGAAAVGMGRPFMYAVNYGTRGVEHAVNVLQDEVETAMRLCGMTDLCLDANANFVNTSAVDHLVFGRSHPYVRERASRTRAKM